MKLETLQKRFMKAEGERYIRYMYENERPNVDLWKLDDKCFIYQQRLIEEMGLNEFVTWLHENVYTKIDNAKNKYNWENE